MVLQVSVKIQTIFFKALQIFLLFCQSHILKRGYYRWGSAEPLFYCHLKSIVLTSKRIWNTQKNLALNPFFLMFWSLCLLKLSSNLPSVNLFQQMTFNVMSGQERGLVLLSFSIKKTFCRFQITVAFLALEQ